MTFQDLGGLGEFVGAFAVVISVIYLAIQIRQNTRSLNSSSYAESAEQAWLVQLAIAQDGELARIWADWIEGKELSREDTVRVESLLSNLFMAGENTFRLYELGLLDSDTWENVFLNAYKAFPPIAVERWRQREGPITKRLLAYLESRHLP